MLVDHPHLPGKQISYAALYKESGQGRYAKFMMSPQVQLQKYTPLQALTALLHSFNITGIASSCRAASCKCAVGVAQAQPQSLCHDKGPLGCDDPLLSYV